MKITFSESKSFYNKLDDSVKNGKTRIIFNNERPNEKSKLWLRLKNCKNWSIIESELQKVKEGKKSKIKKIISPPMAAAFLAGGEIFLIAWILTLLSGLIFYGIYKERKIKLKVNKDEVELDIE